MRGRISRIVALLLSLWMIVAMIPAGVTAVEAEERQDILFDATDYSDNSYVAEKLQAVLDVVTSETPYFNVTGNAGCAASINCSECLLDAVSQNHPLLSKLQLRFEGYVYRGSAAMVRLVTAWIYGIKYGGEIGIYGNIPVTVTNIQRIGRVAVDSPVFKEEYKEPTVGNLKEIMKKGAAGDIIQMRTSAGANHAMILLSAGESDVTVLDCLDYADTEAALKNKMVVTSYSYEELIRQWNMVITLYRVDSETYGKTLAQGETIHTTHVYTDAGRDACTVCGEKFTAVPTVDKAGVYMAGVNTEGYKGYYRSTGNNGKNIPNGKWVEVCGSVVNSTGKLFYILVDGGYVAAEDFVNGSSAKPTINIGAYPAGEVEKGKSFSLSGTVSYASGLAYVSGYLIDADGGVVQSAKSVTSSTSHNIASGQINANLRFAELNLGEYVYLVVACGKDGSMSCFKSTFNVITNDKETPATPAAPTLLSATGTTVTLNVLSGCEYRMSGGSWQNSNVFSGLSPATTYTFYQRVKETATSYPSKESAGLTVTTPKGSSSAPAAPTLQSVTDSTVTLNPLSGCEYRLNGGSWQASNVFTGLSPATSYRFTQRLKETSSANASEESAYLTVVTDKSTPTAPAAPTLFSVTDTTVTLNALSGYEYRMSGGNWQSSNVFSNLSAATEYAFYQRLKETGTAYPSASSAGLSVKTSKSITDAPPTPIAATVTSTSVTLQSVTGCEYKMDNGNWGSSAVFSGLTPGSSHTFYQRYKETGTAEASPSSYGLAVLLPKKTVSAPSAPTAKKITTDSVSLNALAGCEYRIGEGGWQSSTEFSGLTPGSTYTFYQRYAETATTEPSPVSGGYTVTLAKLTVSAPEAPTRQTVSSTGVVLKAFSGMEYKVEGGKWTTNHVFTDLTPGTTYKFYQRYAETSTTAASPESTALSVTLPKKIASAPPTPTEKSVTTGSVTLNKVEGCEYRINMEAWQSSPVFTGLTPGSTYVFYQRYAETATSLASAAGDGLQITLPKLAVNPPNAPTAQSVSADSVTLQKVSGLEYRVDGGKWTDSNIFTGLTPGSTIAFYQRYKETETSLASDSGPALYLTLPKQHTDPPQAPVVLEKTASSITLVARAGEEYRMNRGNWQTSAVFTGLDPNKEYLFEARFAETATKKTSEAGEALKVFTLKNTVSAPAAPKLKEAVGKKVVLMAISGMEYCLDNGEWQTDPTFIVDTYGEHFFLCRVAETNTSYQSAPSGKLVVKVNPIEITSSDEKLVVKNETVSGIAMGETLADVLNKIPEREYVTLKNSRGEDISEDTAVSTGMKLLLPGGEEFVLVVNGDTSGDGVVDIFDLIQIRNQIVSGEGLEGAYATAADVTGDGAIDIFDYIAVRNMIVGSA